MLKKDDKDAIIEFLKSQLKRIANYELTWRDRPDLDDFEYDTYCICPECGYAWDETITTNNKTKKILNKYIKQSTLDNLKMIAEKTLNDVTF